MGRIRISWQIVQNRTVVTTIERSIQRAVLKLSIVATLLRRYHLSTIWCVELYIVVVLLLMSLNNTPVQMVCVLKSAVVVHTSILL